MWGQGGVIQEVGFTELNERLLMLPQRVSPLGSRLLRLSSGLWFRELECGVAQADSVLEGE